MSKVGYHFATWYLVLVSAWWSVSLCEWYWSDNVIWVSIGQRFLARLILANNSSIYRYIDSADIPESKIKNIDIDIGKVDINPPLLYAWSKECLNSITRHCLCLPFVFDIFVLLASNKRHVWKHFRCFAQILRRLRPVHAKENENDRCILVVHYAKWHRAISVLLPGWNISIQLILVWFYIVRWIICISRYALTRKPYIYDIINVAETTRTVGDAYVPS